MVDENQAERASAPNEVNSDADDDATFDGRDQLSGPASMTRRGMLGAAGAAIGTGLFAGQTKAQHQEPWVGEWPRTDSQPMNTTYGNWQHEAEIHARKIFKDRDNNLIKIHKNFNEADWRNLPVPNVYKENYGGGVRGLADTVDPDLHIHVHGHLTPIPKARNEFDTVASQFFGDGGPMKTIGYSWDAYEADGLFDNRERWKKNRTIARLNGKILARTILQIFREYEDRDLFLTGYSLGSQVVLSAIRSLSLKRRHLEPNFGKKGGLINGVALVGAATPRRSTMYHGGEKSREWLYENKLTGKEERIRPYGEDIFLMMMWRQALAQSFMNFRSTDDGTLGLFYEGGDGKTALGKYGPYPNKKNSWNADNCLLAQGWKCNKIDHSQWNSTGDVWQLIRVGMINSGLQPYGANINNLPIMPGDHYRIEAVHSNMAVEEGDELADYELLQDLKIDGDSQRWVAALEDSLPNNGDAAIYKFKNVKSGKLAYNSPRQDELQVVQMTGGSEHGSDRAKWKVKDKGGGEYTIRSMAGTKPIVGVESDADYAGARLTVNVQNTSEYRFRFNSISGSVGKRDLPTISEQA